MKKTFAIICVLITLIVSQAYRGAGLKSGDSALPNNVSVVSLTDGIMFVAFYDAEVGKIGLLYNNSKMLVKEVPTYDDSYYNGYKLLAVKKDGMWGVIDLGGRYNFGKDLGKPIIDCKYNSIRIENDDVVICDGKRIDISKKYERWN